MVLRSPRLVLSALLPELDAKLRSPDSAAIDLESPETLDM